MTDYVKPPKKEKNTNYVKKVTGMYGYLHPNYWKRKLVHLIIVFPFVFVIDGVIFRNALIGLVLAIISSFFYPFSLYWYKKSFIGQFLNSIYHIGGFWSILSRILATILGGIVIAGVLAPIMGPITYYNCKKKGIMIGDAKDFE